MCIEEKIELLHNAPKFLSRDYDLHYELRYPLLGNSSHKKKLCVSSKSKSLVKK